MKLRFVWFLLCAWPLLAQNDMHANINLQFRFANPGARAQAMGGAFVGLADDTTAIFANPAGLTQMASNTLGLEVGSTRYDNNIPFAGGRITQTAFQDFSFDLTRKDFPETITSVPFLGYVHVKSKIKWGVFLAEQANFKRTFDTESIGIPPHASRLVDIDQLNIVLPTRNTVDMQFRTLGVSVAGKWGQRISYGLTLGLNQLKYQAQTDQFFPDFEAVFPEFNFPPSVLADFRPLINQHLTAIDVNGDDEAVSIYGGLLFQPSDRFSVGVSYKDQPKFDYNWTSRAFAFPTIGQEASDHQGAAPFEMPDSFNLGFSFRPNEAFVFSAELSRIFYSALSDTYFSFFTPDLTDDQFDIIDPTGATQKAADITEYHLGGEYFFINLTYPLAVRLGYWFEPYHALTNDTLDTQVVFRTLNQNGDFIAATRPALFLQQFEKDLNHFTFGLGLSIGRHLVLDLSGDVADSVSTYSLSGIYRF